MAKPLPQPISRRLTGGSGYGLGVHRPPRHHSYCFPERFRTGSSRSFVIFKNFPNFGTAHLRLAVSNYQTGRSDLLTVLQCLGSWATFLSPTGRLNLPTSCSSSKTPSLLKQLCSDFCVDRANRKNV